MKPTIEQENIVKFINTNNEDLKISAFAGTGKTSTLKLIANTLPEMSFLYLAYNKDIQLSAEKSFPKNVYCNTYHALARRAMQIDKSRYKEKLNIKAKQIEIINLLEINDNKSYNPYSIIPIIKKTVSNFKISSDKKIELCHLDLDGIMELTSRPSEQESLCQLILDKSKKLWSLEVNLNSNVPIDHDTYVKMWHLSGAKIEVDFILFDEAQDANPVVLDIVKSQICRKIYVGDVHQKIYAWRGAVNAMNEINANELYLTQSFRFGPAVAEVANKILILKGEKRKLIGFDKIESKIAELDESLPFTCVCRTNAEIYIQAIYYAEQGKKISICGGVGDLTLRCKSAYYLFAGKNHMVTFYDYKKYFTRNERKAPTSKVGDISELKRPQHQ
ncbi:MAG: UvrD-helicase domain-containing protein, partial [Silvanigrellaceae bacterium]|nr:UvrD-helicase domain-containing protein [Silvanigrellaceae bacterium]